MQFNFLEKSHSRTSHTGIAAAAISDRIQRRYTEKVKNYVCGMPSQGSD